VDDGSSIDYHDIISRYPVRYIKTDNCGILCARLRGIAMARGEYIAFVDSDDLVSLGYYISMYKAALACGCDVVINDWAFKSDRSVYYCPIDSIISWDILARGDEVLRLFFSKRGSEHSYYVLWNKIYRASVMKRAVKPLNDIVIKAYNYSEDALINFCVFSSAKHVKNIHTGYYFYRVHESQSVSVISEERLKQQIICMSQTFRFMSNTLVKMGREELLPDLHSWQELMSRTHYTYAKTRGYSALYDQIRSSYGVDVLKENYRSDSASYSKVKLLPNNHREIDESFSAMMMRGSVIDANFNRRDRYITTIIRALNVLGFSVIFDNQGARVPEPSISLTSRILHNRLLRSAADVLFRKGSFMRSFLKKYL